MSQKPKAKDISEKLEKDVTSLRWDNERASAIVEAMKAYEEEGNTTKANEMRWEGFRGSHVYGMMTTNIY